MKIYLVYMLILFNTISCSQESTPQDNGLPESAKHISAETYAAIENLNSIEDDSGNVLMYWFENESLIYRYKPFSQTWSEAKAHPMKMFNPQFATNGSTIMLVDKISQHIKYSVFDGNVWSVEKTIISPDSIVGDLNKFILQSNGSNYMLVAEKRVASQNSLIYTIFENEQWSNPADVVLNTTYIAKLNLQSDGKGYALLYNSNDSERNVTVFSSNSWKSILLGELNNGNPVLDVDLKGSLNGYLAVWRQISGTQTGIFQDRYSNETSTWTDAVQLDDGLKESDTLNLTSDGKGYLVAWRDNLGASQYQLMARVYNGAWLDQEHLDAQFGSASNYKLTIASNGSGYSVGWLAGAKLHNNIYDDVEGWLGQKILISNNASSTRPNKLFMMSNGDTYAFLAMMYDSVTGYTLYTNITDANFSWAAEAKELASQFYITGNIIRDPQHIMLQYSNEYHAMWLEHNGEGPVYVGLSTEQISDLENPTQTKLVSMSSGSVLLGKYISRDDGTAILVWKQKNGREAYAYISVNRGVGWEQAEYLKDCPRARDTGSINLFSNGKDFMIHCSGEIPGFGYVSASFAVSFDGTNVVSVQQVPQGGSLATNGNTYIMIGARNGVLPGTSDLVKYTYEQKTWTVTPEIVVSDIKYSTIPQLQSNGNSYVIAWNAPGIGPRELHSSIYDPIGNKWVYSLVTATGVLEAISVDTNNDYSVLYENTNLYTKKSSAQGWIDEKPVQTNKSLSPLMAIFTENSSATSLIWFASNQLYFNNYNSDTWLEEAPLTQLPQKPSHISSVKNGDNLSISTHSLNTNSSTTIHLRNGSWMEPKTFQGTAIRYFVTEKGIQELSVQESQDHPVDKISRRLYFGEIRN